MGKRKELEDLAEKEDLSPAVESAMHKFMGITIQELASDITTRLAKNPLFEFVIDTHLPFKEAKKRFKQEYLRRLLRVTYGNISEVAKLAGVDRRSIHRIVKDADIDVATIREEMIKPYEIRQKAIGGIIEDVLDNYRQMIHPEKLADMYAHVEDVSRDLVEEMPDDFPDLKSAEEDFERRYFEKVLVEYPSLTKAARATQIRYETLLRKLKALKLR